jgi:Tfp pilus assembly protein PilO
MNNNEDPSTHIALLSQDIQYIRKEMVEIKDRLDMLLEHYVKRDEVEARIADIRQAQDKFHLVVNEQLKKKAGSWVENVLIFVGSTIGLAVIGAILSLILIK